jgi:hypothetical protein
VFLAKYLLTNKPEDKSVEKLLTRIRDKEEISPISPTVIEQDS